MITLQNRHAGIPFLSGVVNRAEGPNSTAPVIEQPYNAMVIGLFWCAR